MLTLALTLGGCSKSKRMLSTMADNTAVTEYKDQEVKKKDVDRLLQAGMSAPCARGVSQWKFFVIAPDKMASVNKLPSLGGASMKAKCAILVCGLSARFGDGDARALWSQDCAAASQNIVLAARSMGITPEWIRIYPFSPRQREIKKALNLDPGITPFSIITLGYAEETSPVKVQEKENEVVWLGSFD